MCSMFGGRGVGDAHGLGDELLDRGEGERGVEAPLLADRRRALLAHARAAQRAGHVAGHHPQVVGQLEQAVEAVEEPLGALACLDGEIGARRGADEQRVAGEQRVPGEKAAVLGPVAGRVQRADARASRRRSRPRRPAPRVGYDDVRVAVDCDRQSLLEREAAVAGDVVGVRVRLEHARDRAVRLRPAASRNGSIA